jgi:hypothetical protein
MLSNAAITWPQIVCGAKHAFFRRRLRCMAMLGINARDCDFILDRRLLDE